MLLEVVITSLIVGLITIATLTGFNAVDKTTAAQRQHDEASFLAAESQEALRSDPASALELLETTPHQLLQQHRSPMTSNLNHILRRIRMWRRMQRHQKKPAERERHQGDLHRDLARATKRAPARGR